MEGISTSPHESPFRVLDSKTIANKVTVVLCCGLRVTGRGGGVSRLAQPFLNRRVTE